MEARAFEARHGKNPYSDFILKYGRRGGLVAPRLAHQLCGIALAGQLGFNLFYGTQGHPIHGPGADNTRAMDSLYPSSR
jgi:hypothetical protein